MCLRYQTAFLVIVLSFGSHVRAEAGGVAGNWEGYIKTRSEKVGISLTLRDSPAGMTGSVVVPMWGNGSWPLQDLELKGGQLTFRIAGLKAPDGTFEFTWKDKELSGHYTWDDRDFDVRCGRELLSESQFPRYPQIPPGVEPYTVTPVKIPSGGIDVTGVARQCGESGIMD